MARQFSSASLEGVRQPGGAARRRFRLIRPGCSPWFSTRRRSKPHNPADQTTREPHVRTASRLRCGAGTLGSRLCDADALEVTTDSLCVAPGRIIATYGEKAMRGRGGFETGQGPPLDSCSARRLATMRRPTRLDAARDESSVPGTGAWGVARRRALPRHVLEPLRRGCGARGTGRGGTRTDSGSWAADWTTPSRLPGSGSGRPRSKGSPSRPARY